MNGLVNVFVDKSNGIVARYSPCPEQIELAADARDGVTLIAAPMH